LLGEILLRLLQSMPVEITLSKLEIILLATDPHRQTQTLFVTFRINAGIFPPVA
jgi:hypothetical protein